MTSVVVLQQQIVLGRFLGIADFLDFNKCLLKCTLQECSCLINDIYGHKHQHTMQKYIVCLADNDAKTPATYGLKVPIILPTTRWFRHSGTEPCLTPHISATNI